MSSSPWLPRTGQRPSGSSTGWQTLSQRRRLIELASQLSYYVGRLHSNAGRYAQAWQFATLTHRYAAQTDDLVLRHSAVALQSSAAFYGGKHRRAAEIMERGDQYATPYTRARGLAYAARGYSALGDQQSTLKALRGMREAIVEQPARVGMTPFTDASALLVTTACLRWLGDGTGAAAAGREAVVAFDAGRGPSRDEQSHAHVALALALTTRNGSAPDEAAALGNNGWSQAVRATERHAA
jgi:hypothetical protein